MAISSDGIAASGGEVFQVHHLLLENALHTCTVDFLLLELFVTCTVLVHFKLTTKNAVYSFLVIGFSHVLCHTFQGNSSLSTFCK